MAAALFSLSCASPVVSGERSALKNIVYVDAEIPAAHTEFDTLRKGLIGLHIDVSRMQFVGVPSLSAVAYTGELVQKLAAIKPDLILAAGPIEAQAIRAALPNTPLLFLSNVNPVNLKLVDALGIRTINSTGVSFYQPIEAKQLEILKVCAPNIRSVAILVDQPLVVAGDMLAFVNAGAVLGVRVEIIVREPGESGDSIAKLLSSVKADAWLIPPTGIAVAHRQVLLDYFKANPKPVLYGRTKILSMGGLLTYDDTLNDWHSVWAKQVLLFTKGMPLSQIPVERPNGYDFGINLSAAKKLSSKLTKSCLVRANLFVD